MEAARVREASGRVIAALAAACRSGTTIQCYEAELSAFARFLQARGQDLPAEADCLDFVAERSGCRLAGLRERVSSRRAQLARRPLVLLMECLDGGMPEVSQLSVPLADRCPPRFRRARDDYVAACRRRRNAEATVVTSKRAADAFLAYLEEAGRESVGQVQAMDLAGFWARRRSYAAKTNGTLRSSLAGFLRHLHRTGQISEDLASRLPPQRYPRRGQTAPYPWTAGEVRLVPGQIGRQSAIGKRDYAMILLTARLGLRVGDLRRLEAGWFDWRAKTLTLTQHKTGVALRLPVPGDVGWAVTGYIRQGRPEAGCAQLFVKHRYPFTAFGSSSSAGCRLGYYARRAGIVFPPRRYHGLHSLRGALAVAMLQAETPPAGGHGGPGSRSCHDNRRTLPAA